jgi:SAM-dependent methyltransferase
VGDCALIDERAFAGAEHLDPAYVAGYDRKTGFDVESDVALLRELGLGRSSTLVDLGAGTGQLAAAAASFAGRVVAVDPSPAMLDVARARGGFETVEAGFLTYEHEGDRPDVVYTRNALHHLPDFWKALALRRMHELLAGGGLLVLRDIVYAFDPAEADAALSAWYAAAVVDPAEGWTAGELEHHVRTEHSTYAWLLEPMLDRAGFEIRDTWYSESRTYARYVAARR